MAVALPGRDFPGVGCGLVIIRDHKVLLLKRLKAPETGFWNIPGGKIDAMEPSANAARREATEETGLTFGPVSFLCVSEQIIDTDRQRWVSLIYVAESFTGEPRMTEADKFSDMSWFPLADLPEQLSRFSKDAFSALARRDYLPFCNFP